MNNTILPVFLSISVLLQSAADEKPKEITGKDIVGFACSQRGHGECITTLQTQSNHPSCTISLVYSEHPNLQAPADLKKIAQILRQRTSWEKFFEFQDICKEEAEHYQAPVSENLLHDNNAPIVLLAVILELDVHRIRGVMSYQLTGFDEDSSNSYFIHTPLRADMQERSSVIITHDFSQDYTKVLEDPQTEANQEQLEHPEEPFHLMINLAPWKELILPHYLKLKEERKRGVQKCTYST